MPKLVYSSETVGCGATIELDSTEICIISVAQSGVLVRSHKKQSQKWILGRLLGSFYGSKIYNQTDVYKAAKTALALADLYPEPNASLVFQNPVLSAFANAVWHCSSAAEVSVVLNEAYESLVTQEISAPVVAPPR
ncbi:MAG: hypothetical protein ACLPID_07755 [Beijerinckiaceae bacterium]